MAEPTVRPATEADLDGITCVYDQYIVDSAVSFDVEPWSRARRLAWWEDHQGHDRLVVLVAEADAAGAHRAYAVVTLPNDASVALHHRLGFRDVGVEDECGWKLGRWWSTLTLEKRFDPT